MLQGTSNVEIRIADSGVHREYEIPKDGKMTQIQQQLRRDFRVEPADQLLILKDGITFLPTDNLQAFAQQTYKNRTHTPTASGKFKSTICMYLFNRKLLRSSEQLPTPDEQQLIKQLEERIERIHPAYKGLTVLPEIQNSKRFQQFSRVQKDLPKLYDFLVNGYQSFFQQLSRFEYVKVQVEESMQQLQSIHKAAYAILFSSLKVNSDVIGRKLQSFEKKLNSCIMAEEQNEVGINRMKDFIPDELQAEKQFRGKSLYSIYFSNVPEDEVRRISSKLDGLKKSVEVNRVKLSQLCSEKTGKIYEFRKSIKNRIMKQHWDASSVEKHTSFVNSLLEEVIARRRDIADKIERAMRDSSEIEGMRIIQNSAEFVLVEDRRLKQVEEDISKIRSELLRKYLDFELARPSVLELLKEAFAAYQNSVNQFLGIECQIFTKQTQLSGLQREIESTSLDGIHMCYSMSVQEAQRRKMFSRKFEGMLIKLTELVQQEQTLRKKYVNDRKKLKVQRQIFSQLSCTSTYSVRVENQDPGLVVAKLDFSRSVLDDKTNSYLVPMDDCEKALQDLEKLTKDVSNYRKSGNLSDHNSNRMRSIEDILIKSSQIYQQLYRRKLEEETASVMESKNRLEATVFTLKNQLTDIDSRQAKYKDEIKAMKLKNSQLAEENQYLREQLKKELSNKIYDSQAIRSELASKEKQLSNLTAQLKEIYWKYKCLSQKQEEDLKLHQEELLQVIKKKEQAQSDSIKLRQELQGLRHSSPQQSNQNQSAVQEIISALQKQNMDVKQINEQLQIELELKTKNEAKYKQLQAEHQKQCTLTQQLKEMLAAKELEIIKLEKALESIPNGQMEKSSADEDSIDAEQQSSLRAEQLELVRLREDYARLEEDYEYVNNELRAMLKDTEQVETQTDIITRVRQGLSIQNIEEKSTNAFVSCAAGIYVPLVAMERQWTEIQFLNTTLSLYRQNIFLDLGCLQPKIRDIVSENNLIIIGEVSQIRDRVTTVDDNPFGLRINQSYRMVTIERPSLVLGFEEDDITLTNYANI